MTNNTTIETYTGQMFDLLDPQPCMIVATDIIVSLSRICRFNGHCKYFYSVAEHTVWVTEETSKLSGQGDIDRLVKLAVLHDAAEAYVGDLCRPIKRLVPEFHRVEWRILNAIFERFDFIPTSKEWEIIHKIDDTVLLEEARILMPSKGIDWRENRDSSEMRLSLDCWQPEDAAVQLRTVFRDVFWEIKDYVSA